MPCQWILVERKVGCQVTKVSQHVKLVYGLTPYLWFPMDGVPAEHHPEAFSRARRTWQKDGSAGEARRVQQLLFQRSDGSSQFPVWVLWVDVDIVTRSRVRFCVQAVSFGHVWRVGDPIEDRHVVVCEWSLFLEVVQGVPPKGRIFNYK